MAGECAIHSFPVLETSAHVIVGHLDDSGVVGEKDWPIFGVVGYMPDAGGGFQQGLVAIIIKFRIHFTQRHRVHGV